MVFLLVVLDRNALPDESVLLQLIHHDLCRRQQFYQQGVKRCEDKVVELDLERGNARFLSVVLLHRCPSQLLLHVTCNTNFQDPVTNQ